MLESLGEKGDNLLDIAIMQNYYLNCMVLETS